MYSISDSSSKGRQGMAYARARGKGREDVRDDSRRIVGPILGRAWPSLSGRGAATRRIGPIYVYGRACALFKESSMYTYIDAFRRISFLKEKIPWDASACARVMSNRPLSGPVYRVFCFSALVLARCSFIYPVMSSGAALVLAASASRSTLFVCWLLTPIDMQAACQESADSLESALALACEKFHILECLECLTLLSEL